MVIINAAVTQKLGEMQMNVERGGGEAGCRCGREHLAADGGRRKTFNP